MRPRSLLVVQLVAPSGVHIYGLKGRLKLDKVVPFYVALLYVSRKYQVHKAKLMNICENLMTSLGLNLSSIRWRLS
jgi:hypothetical protein